jgi:GntR family transcriptional repressor for pyruvate dehydrogenase complex
MRRGTGPLARQRLADDLAQRVKELIQTGGYQPGARLPSIAEMSRRFGVAHPTLREALRRLETLGYVDIRHGSGVYVQRQHGALLLTNPTFEGRVTRALLLDLAQAREGIERAAAELAARACPADQLAALWRMQEEVGRRLRERAVVVAANVAFHRGIAQASGNQVLAQLVEVLSALIEEEQRRVLGPLAFRRRCHREHAGILEAVAQHRSELAAERMEAHLASVRAALLRSDAREGGR